jgi:hypothetical protein
MCTPLVFYQHLFSLHHPLTQPHFTTPPATQPVLLCSLHPTPRQHPLSPPDMSHLKPFSPLTPIITPTLHDHSRTNLVSWKIAINRAARGVFAEWDATASYLAYATTRSRISSTPPRGNS